MKPIQFSREETADITARLRTYFRDELEMDLAALPAEMLLDFLEEAQLDRVGCFAYSPVEGASANELPDPVPDEVREERRARFMQVQESISTGRLKRFVGRTMRVLVDGFEQTDGGMVAVGRTAMDAPEIDGVVRFTGSGKLGPGEFVDVEITGSDAHDLSGRLVR